ncbi:MAG TPA: septal ring lytic transglycosylase RlpA family protein [Methylomirabilota bacterium]|nr:septal ring lytic transglycosylase RlpA family protein [Methylomirabilota bacterium]
MRTAFLRGTVAWSILAGFALAACARPTITTPPVPPRLGLEETGLASWYGNPYHGRHTASGEIYDMRDLTAAHRTLPMGTRLMVTNLDNGQAVEVRVNDRGPFVEGRILDLSYAAASVLGAIGRGVIPVRLRVIALAGAPVAASAPGFSVQLGAFTTRARAEALRSAVSRDGVEAAIAETVVGGEAFYRVRVGIYPDRAAAQAAAQRLAARGYRALVVER